MKPRETVIASGCSKWHSELPGYGRLHVFWAGWKYEFCLRCMLMDKVDQTVEERQQLRVFSDSGAEHDPIPRFAPKCALDRFKAFWAGADHFTQRIDSKASELSLNALRHCSVETERYHLQGV